MGAIGLSPLETSGCYGTANCGRELTRRYWNRIVSKAIKDYQFPLSETATGKTRINMNSFNTRWHVIALLVLGVGVPGCDGKDSAGPLYEIHCAEPVPIFSRTSHASRTPELDAKLCKCIWVKLDGTDRSTAQKMFKEEWDQISAHDADHFKSHFGEIAVDCGP